MTLPGQSYFRRRRRERRAITLDVTVRERSGAAIYATRIQLDPDARDRPAAFQLELPGPEPFVFALGMAFILDIVAQP